MIRRVGALPHHDNRFCSFGSRLRDFVADSTRLGGIRALHRHDVIPGVVHHQSRHALRVAAVNMAVGLEDQLTAVFIPLPFGNHFHIDALSIERVMNIRRRECWLNGG